MNIDKDSSKCVAESLIQANLRGYDTHGVVRLIAYIKRLRSIKWNMPKVIENGGAIGMIDGNDFMGQVCAKMAMDLAIKKAMKFGVGIVGVRNSNHFGAAAYFSMLAAEKNMIGFAFTNASPRIPAWGGKEAVLGNNPFSFAIPTNKGYPLVLDISNSVVAAGKIRTAALRGEKIPEGWAMDKDGNMTQNPEEALKGLLFPIGGHKGYGITLVMDILCGILTGSGFSKQVVGIDKTESAQHVGHLLGAINISKFMPQNEFMRRMDQLINVLKSSKKANGINEIFIPGEIEHLTNKKRLKEGIPIPKKIIDTLNGLAEELGEESRITKLSP
jgi:LDH2 family malate/lactate/ureidoglycolate dehydrogenase